VLVQHALLDAGDTLCIEPVGHWGTKEWKEKEAAILQHGAPAPRN
jgi:hypothetical protein